MGLFPSSTPSLASVLDDLSTVDENKVLLMQRYSNRQKEILQGMTVSDLPIDGNHEYFILSEKKRILNGLENR